MKSYKLFIVLNVLDALTTACGLFWFETMEANIWINFLISTLGIISALVIKVSTAAVIGVCLEERKQFKILKALNIVFIVIVSLNILTIVMQSIA